LILIGWRAKNAANPSAAPRGFWYWSPCVASGRMNGSACGIHSFTRSWPSENSGPERAPSTASSGCLIRAAISAVKSHSARAGNSTSKKVSASAMAVHTSPREVCGLPVPASHLSPALRFRTLKLASASPHWSAGEAWRAQLAGFRDMARPVSDAQIIEESRTCRQQTYRIMGKDRQVVKRLVD
jgi:hypothetical protein